MPEAELYQLKADWDTLELALAGDERAWRRLFEQHAPSLLRMTALVTGSADSAKDLVQETFLRLVGRTPEHRDGTVRAYLSTIAFRLALKEKGRWRRDHHEKDGDPVAHDPSPLEMTVRREEERGVLSVLMSLPDAQREILVLRFYAGLSYEEIAAATGIPIGTVKSRIFYAVKTSRKELRKRGVL